MLKDSYFKKMRILNYKVKIMKLKIKMKQMN